MSTFEEVREYAVNHYDPDLLVEVLGITSESLLCHYEDQFIRNIRMFEEELEYVSD
jgi:hypothetical protein